MNPFVFVLLLLCICAASAQQNGTDNGTNVTIPEKNISRPANNNTGENSTLPANNSTDSRIILARNFAAPIDGNNSSFSSGFVLPSDFPVYEPPTDTVDLSAGPKVPAGEEGEPTIPSKPTIHILPIPSPPQFPRIYV